MSTRIDASIEPSPWSPRSNGPPLTRTTTHNTPADDDDDAQRRVRTVMSCPLDGKRPKRSHSPNQHRANNRRAEGEGDAGRGADRQVVGSDERAPPRRAASRARMGRQETAYIQLGGKRKCSRRTVPACKRYIHSRRRGRRRCRRHLLRETVCAAGLSISISFSFSLSFSHACERAPLSGVTERLSRVSCTGARGRHAAQSFALAAAAAAVARRAAAEAAGGARADRLAVREAARELEHRALDRAHAHREDLLVHDAEPRLEPPVHARGDGADRVVDGVRGRRRPRARDGEHDLIRWVGVAR